jgi:biotin carboxyl carrier protein
MTEATVELDGRTYEVAIARQGAGWTVTVDGQEIPVHLERNGAGTRVAAGGKSIHVELAGGTCRIDGHPRTWRIVSVSSAGEAAGAAGHHAAKVRPPMNGKLERILVKPGQEVSKGEILFVLEAMKMQNEVRSPVAGRVAAVHGVVGAAVEPSQVIIELESA